MLIDYIAISCTQLRPNYDEEEEEEEKFKEQLQQWKKTEEVLCKNMPQSQKNALEQIFMRYPPSPMNQLSFSSRIHSSYATLSSGIL